MKELEAIAKADGHSDAMVALGICAMFMPPELGMDGESRRTAVRKWWKKGSDLGNYEAMYHYGQLLVEGTFGVERDEARGGALMRRSAEAGNAGGMLGVAELYSVGGRGIQQSDDLAIEWTRKSAELSGRPIAIYNLGCQLRDTKKGRDSEITDIFREAYEQGHNGATYNLGTRTFNGVGTRRDEVAAVALFERAAAQGNEGAMKNLIGVYEFGAPEINANPKKAAFFNRLLQKEKEVAYSEEELEASARS
jgi:TPR repeat protein